MMAAMPIMVRSNVPSVRRRPYSSPGCPGTNSASENPEAASAWICAIDFLRNKELAIDMSYPPAEWTQVSKPKKLTRAVYKLCRILNQTMKRCKTHLDSLTD